MSDITRSNPTEKDPPDDQTRGELVAGRSSRRRETLLQVIILLAVPWVFYFPVLNLGWLYDDAFNLLWVMRHAAVSYFSSPATWGELPFSMYTPLQMISYEFDLVAWGPHPAGFYVHNLVAVSLLAVSGWLALRTRTGAWPALVGALVFILGPTSSRMAELIMIRHYTEGFAFFFLSIWLWDRKRAWRWAGPASAFVYGLSLLCKEIFVAGFPLFFVCGERQPLRRRMLDLGWHTATIVAYALLRTWMLGSLGGSYGWHVRSGDFPVLAVTLLPRILGLLFRDFWPAWLILVGWVVWWSRRGLLVVTLLSCLIVSLPYVPVSTVIEPRYTLSVWAVICGMFAFAVSRLPQRRAMVLGSAIVILALVSNRIDFARNQTLFSRMTVEQRVPSLPGEAALRNPAAHPAVMRSLLELGRTLDEPAFHDWFQEDVSLCDGEVGSTILEYDDGTQSLVSRDVTTLRDHACVFRSVPITVELWREGDGIRWSFAPRMDGRWVVMVEDHTSVWTVPPEAGFIMPDVSRLRLRVGFHSDEGWSSWTAWLEAGISSNHWRWTSVPG